MCRVSQVLQGGVGVGVGLLACFVVESREWWVKKDQMNGQRPLRGMKRLGFLKSYVLPGRSVGITEGWEKKGFGMEQEREKKSEGGKGSVWSYLAVPGSMSKGGRPQLEHWRREGGKRARLQCSDAVDVIQIVHSSRLFLTRSMQAAAAAATSTAEHGREMETSQDRYLLMSWCQKRYAAKGRRHRMARPTPPSSIPPSHGPPPFTHTPLPCQEIHGGAPLLESNCLDAAIFFTCQRAA